MKLPHRRNILHLAAAAAALPALPRIARAQAYPSRFIRLVVPFPPGGAADPIARLIANRLAESWGQQVIIENKGGAGGNLGAQSVAQATPDGYTMLLGAASLSTNQYIYPSIGYDPIKDFAPVTRLCAFPSLFAVPKSSPVTSLREFIDFARTKQGAISYASPGVGLPSHLSGELLKRLAGIEMTHVPYRGSGPALNDLITGRVDAMFGALPGMLPHAESGTIRALAVTSKMRSPSAPTIPAISELGFPSFDSSAWYALLLPAKTLDEIVTKVHDDAVFALAQTDLKGSLEKIGATVTPSTPAELVAFIKHEMEVWGPIIKQAGIKPA